jgi:hypothetical protein
VFCLRGVLLCEWIGGAFARQRGARESSDNPGPSGARKFCLDMGIGN